MTGAYHVLARIFCTVVKRHITGHQRSRRDYHLVLFVTFFIPVSG
jgi:hypothetical protein